MIEARALAARAGAFRLHDVSFTLPGGRWGIVLGPAGAGKTTLLETIAGVRRATAGQLLLRGVDVTQRAPEQRGLGIVYQRGYLFPHLSVRENVHYGASDARWADAMSERFGASALQARPVASLSGGERQIVALARALARRPDILLLDEPFAALDPRRRTHVRRELHALQRELGLTVLQVTHDFAEAGTLGDVALLVEAGRLVQAAPPEELFRRPATAAAAEFLGAENVYAGRATTITSGDDGELGTLRFESGTLSLVAVGEYADGPCHAVIRGEDVVLARGRPGPSSARNVLEGRVHEVAGEGALARVSVDVGGAVLVATVTAGAVRELALAAGVSVVATVKATAVHLC
ncbi:MAG TPA: ABC transporter ATP-binding protein [Gemmatimonadaceae bacterium]|nr:ABC transporter ATP-binding protein [Gemmatimonadaceae bacterium]